MKRRKLLTGAVMLLAAARAPKVLAADEVEAVQQAIKHAYAVFYRDLDERTYRSLLTTGWRMALLHSTRIAPPRE